MLAEKSFRLGEFKLSSGGTSDYYIDCRLTTLDATGALLTGETVLEEIRDRGWQADAIGGLTMGADPIVVATSVITHNRASRSTASWCAKPKSARHRAARRGLPAEGGAGGDRGRRVHHRRLNRSGDRSGARIGSRLPACCAW